MGQKGSSLKKGQRPKSPNEVCSKLNSSSSSYYSNYPELRNEVQPEKQCLSISYKKKKPQWLRFFHSKCENLAPSQLSWAENGKNLAELESMRNFREEYDRLFERKLKDNKQIISNRQSINQKDPESNLDNVLSDLNETAQPPSALQGLGAASKVNEEQYPSVALREDDEGDGQGTGSQKSSQLRLQQQQFGQRNTQVGQNTSFPSYMVENQYQGLRAGNITMMRLQDPETVKKNLLIYFECTTLISSHLEDSNFTLSQIRKLFLGCFYNRYSVALKNFRNSQKEKLRNQAQQEQNQGEFDQQIVPQASQNQNSLFQNSLNAKSIEGRDQEIGLNGSDCKLGINIRSKEFGSQEKFQPPREALKIFKDALSEFEYFVKIFMETIKQYYDIHYLKDPKVNAALKELFSYKNFQNFVVSKLFENDKIPKMLIEILKIVTPDDTPLIASMLSQNISPYLFGVPPAFSLDSETKRSLGILNSVVQEEPECPGETGKASMKQQIKEQQQFYEKQQKEEQAEENDDKDLDSEEDQDMVFDLQITQKKVPKMDAEFQQNEFQRTNSNASSISQENLFCVREPTLIVNPYQRCIDCIRKIINCPTPTGKFKQIILACEGIEKCIIEFYQKLGSTLKYTLNEDNIISILTYIIAQAQVPNLEVHCKFVNAFYKSTTKKQKLKYYLLAFEASVRNVHELFSQGVSQDKEESFTQGDLNEDHPANVSLNTSARNLFQKNVSRKLEETFGNSQNSKIIANITGKNSLLKQTLAEIKP